MDRSSGEDIEGFDVEELAQLAARHAGLDDPTRPSPEEIRNVLLTGVPARRRNDAVEYEKDGIRVIINESKPWKSTAYYLGR
jgi:hypothetical protein